MTRSKFSLLVGMRPDSHGATTPSTSLYPTFFRCILIPGAGKALKMISVRMRRTVCRMFYSTPSPPSPAKPTRPSTRSSRMWHHGSCLYREFLLAANLWRA